MKHRVRIGFAKDIREHVAPYLEAQYSPESQVQALDDGDAGA